MTATLPIDSPTDPLRRHVIDAGTYAELIALSEKALASGLAGADRERWRFLTAEVLEIIRCISPAGSDRRRHLRAVAALTVEVHLPVEASGLVTSSVSGGGLAMRMPEPPDLGTRMVMSIHLPDRPEPVRATASVVWRKDEPAAEAGLSFTEIDENDRDLIEATVVRQLSQIYLSGY
jgi:hypothetical protein